MELKSSSSSPYLQTSAALPSTRRNSFQGVGVEAAAGGGRRSNPSGPTSSDPLCNETSEFLRSSFPMAAMARSNSSNGHGCHHHNEASTTSSSSSSTASAQRRRSVEQQVPGTPGRPLLFLTPSSSSPAHHQLVSARRSVPSKWEDAEKWLRQSSDHRGHHHGKVASKLSGGGLVQRGASGDEGKAPATARRSSLDTNALALYTPPAEVLLKDKFTDNVEPSKESFVFRSSYCEPAKNAAVAVAGGGGGDDDLHRRDIGTEMTPLGSSTTSRCHTPIKSASPLRHNTPTGRSGPLVPYNGASGMDISELTDCHFAKLDLGAQFDAMLINWNSKEEEEEEVSKSLRHFEASAGGGGTCDKRVAADCRWDDDERTKSCIRYQREEAKIQAWINLESAKAEAQSRKLEVKIQKMRSNLEEKLMKRMTSVHRRGEEWRAAAQAQHLQQLRRATTEHHARRVKTITHHLSGTGTNAASCGCFPCNSDNIVSGNLLNYS
uniref:Uncharacterized protein n=1 Tax=Avena sativa TaxID=4498 RepID=A0ACD5WZ92_AVESA